MFCYYCVQSNRGLNHRVQTTMTTPEFRDYHRRVQLFILLYIEAGSYIEEEDDRWEFVVLYERRQRKDAARTPVYHFMGYSSLYPFWCWPDKIRLRLRSLNLIHFHRRRKLMDFF